VHLKDKRDSVMDVGHIRDGCVTNVAVTGKTGLGGFGRAAVVEAPVSALPRPEALRKIRGEGRAVDDGEAGAVISCGV
jgi:hypothetical protein